MVFKRGWLKNGNTPGDPTKSPRCGAKNRAGNPCQAPAMRGKRRCRLHGGKSTGAKTKAGIQRIRLAHWKDGSRSARLQAEAKAEALRRENELRRMLAADLDTTTISTRLLVGSTVLPSIKVRIRKVSKKPPADWLK